MTAEHAHEPSSSRTYYVVFVALMVLLAVTVGAAELDLGPLNLGVAAAIASVKAVLILLFFMHVWQSRPLIWLIAGAGVAWLGILLALTLSDYFTRSSGAW